MLSWRTKISLGQFLRLQTIGSLNTLLLKNDFAIPTPGHEVELILLNATEEQLSSLLDEILRTQGTLRHEVSPRYRFDERFDDLQRCLLLDGIRIENKGLVAIEPTLDGAVPLEDDLARELKKSRLPDQEEVMRMVNSSAESFRRAPPDYNGCLSNARVALQTLATNIAKHRRATHAGLFDESKWGQVLSYLRMTCPL